MGTFLSKWWAPLITHPLFFFVVILLLPMGTLTLLNSRSLIIAEIIAGCFWGPIFLAKIHGGSIKTALALIAIFSAGIFLTWPTEQMGNWKMQIADHILAWATVGFFSCAMIQTGLLYRAFRDLD